MVESEKKGDFPKMSNWVWLIHLISLGFSFSNFNSLVAERSHGG